MVGGLDGCSMNGWDGRLRYPLHRIQSWEVFFAELLVGLSTPAALEPQSWRCESRIVSR